MTRTRTGIFAVLVTLVLLAPLSAQQPPSLAPGQRVRLTGPLGRASQIIGEFRGMRGDTVVLLESRSMNEMTVPHGWIRAVEVSAGRRYYGGVGAGAGVFLGLAIVQNTKPPQAASDRMWGIVIGVGVGALVGELLSVERWTEVPLDRLRLTLAPVTEGRLGLGASLAF